MGGAGLCGGGWVGLGCGDWVGPGCGDWMGMWRLGGWVGLCLARMYKLGGGSVGLG